MDTLANFAVIALILGLLITQPVWWVGVLVFVGGFALICCAVALAAEPAK